MKPVHLWLAALAVLVVNDGPPAKDNAPRTVESHRLGAETQEIHRAARRMAAVVSDLRAAQGRGDSGTGQSAGDLWIEVNHLKREGHQTRQIEWYVSDLEGNLRRGQEGIAARRHILNNLEYELQALRRAAP